jgi:protein disulfide-isomerase
MAGNTFLTGQWPIYADKEPSPYSPHCTAFAPTYQTLYEYYYTSNPPASPGEPSDTTATTFEEYYDIRFSVLDCIAASDICNKNGINAYPQTVLYKNGEALGSVLGNKNITMVSNLIENVLEAEKLGTRLKDPLLPTPGANSRPVPEDKAKGKFPTDESQKPMVVDKAADKTVLSI